MTERSKQYTEAIKQLRDEFFQAYTKAAGHAPSSHDLAKMNGDLVEVYMGDLGEGHDKHSVLRGAQRGVLHMFDTLNNALKMAAADSSTSPELIAALQTLIAQVTRGLIASQQNTIEAIEFAKQLEGMGLGGSKNE